MPPTPERRALILQHCFVENHAPQEDSIIHVAAMHAGASLYDEKNNILSDFSTNYKKPYFIYSDILCPEFSPAWVKDRSFLWNKVEAFFNNQKTNVAIEIKLSLPFDLENEEYIELTKNFTTKELINCGLISDTSVHLSKKHDPHAHLLIPAVSVDENGMLHYQEQRLESLLNVIELQWASYVAK